MNTGKVIRSETLTNRVSCEVRGFIEINLSTEKKDQLVFVLRSQLLAFTQPMRTVRQDHVPSIGL